MSHSGIDGVTRGDEIGAIPTPMQSVVGDASARHVVDRAAVIGLFMRHTVVLCVAVSAITLGRQGMQTYGCLALSLAAAWSGWRIWTHVSSTTLTAVDVVVTAAICWTIPLITNDPRFYETNSAPQAIAGTTVISVAVAMGPKFSTLATVAVASSYAAGAAMSIGWVQVGSVLAVYYFALQWTASALIRLLLLRVAAAVDLAREERESAEAERRIGEAIRDSDREQLSLLHDTVASTLLLVGQDVGLPPERLAMQAHRDLDLLRSGPWRAAGSTADLIAELRVLLSHVELPVHLRSPEFVVLPGRVIQAVIGSSREALNNVQRHARARSVKVDVGVGYLAIADDGIGFDATARAGHGLANSMVARMQRVGGSVTTTSTVNGGTRVEMCWPSDSTAESARSGSSTTDADRLIPRLRSTYARALSGYALANIVATVPYAMAHHSTDMQLATGVVAALCASTTCARPSMRAGLTWPMLALLLLMSVLQTVTLPANVIGTQSDWVQSGIGWCAVPLVLAMALPRGIAVITMFWFIGATIEVLRRPDITALSNVAYGTASILGVQLFALAFDGLLRGAADHVHADVEERKRVIVDHRVATKVAADYQVRYAAIVDSVLPLLHELAGDGMITPDRRRRAAIETRRMRALFEQSGSVTEGSLMERIRLIADEHDRLRTDVTIDVTGVIHEPSSGDVDEIAAIVRNVLSADMNSARIVVVAGATGPSVSILCRNVVDPAELMHRGREAGATTVISESDTVWLIIEPTNARGRVDR